MESLNKINTLYKIAHLMDGDFDGKQLHFNKTRHYLSYLVECVNYFFALTHFYVFIYHDRKDDLVYYKVHDGAFSNFNKVHTVKTNRFLFQG